MKNNNFTALTTSNVQEFIGKRINFFCEQYSANANIEGIGTITAVDLSQRSIITGFDFEEGEDAMRFAFVGWDNNICLGDADRTIFVKVL